MKRRRRRKKRRRRRRVGAAAEEKQWLLAVIPSNQTRCYISSCPNTHPHVHLFAAEAEIDLQFVRRGLDIWPWCAYLFNFDIKFCCCRTNRSLWADVRRLYDPPLPPINHTAASSNSSKYKHGNPSPPDNIQRPILSIPKIQSMTLNLDARLLKSTHPCRNYSPSKNVAARRLTGTKIREEISHVLFICF